MTTRHTIIEANRLAAQDLIIEVMRHPSYESFVRAALVLRKADLEGREVSSYSPDDSQVDVFIPEGHFLLTFNLAEKTFLLEEIRAIAKTEADETERNRR